MKNGDYVADCRSYNQWREIMTEEIAAASAFEIHCWAEETQEIAMCLQFGTPKESDWKYGIIIEGKVTQDFIDFLLSLPKPTDTEIYNKMTPFFTIALDTGFWSMHYGTEMSKE